MTKVRQRFNMVDAKLLGSTLSANCKLSEKQSPKTKAEKDEMMKVPYASTVGSLMYRMVCTWLDIRYVVRVIRRFMRNRGESTGPSSSGYPSI